MGYIFIKLVHAYYGMGCIGGMNSKNQYVSLQCALRIAEKKLKKIVSKSLIYHGHMS